MVGLFKYPKRKLKKLLQEGEYEEAIALGNSMESEFSEDSDFMFIMGSIYLIVDDAKKALSYFEKAFSLDSEDVEILSLKTNAHLALGEKDNAIACCKYILKLQPKNTEAQDLLAQLESID